jgi:hypothetical protein
VKWRLQMHVAAFTPGELQLPSPELARLAVADSATAVAAEFALRQGAGALVCTSGGVHATLTDMVQKRILHAIITVRGG